MEATLNSQKMRLFCALLAGITSSCTNNLNVKSTVTSVQAVTPTNGTASGTQGAFTLSRVLKDTINPTSVLDLIGDGSGAFAQLCQSSGQGSNSCNCTYTYSSPTVPSQKVDTPVIYSETDLLRCNYGAIAADVTSLTVSIHVIPTDSYSNSVVFNYSGKNVTLDTSLIRNFIEPERYQCHDILTGIKYLFDSSIYDPVLSEDFHKTFPLDYYYVNPGGNILTYALSQARVKNWICPSVLDPSVTFNNATDLYNYESQNHINLYVYSKTALSTGSAATAQVIYPPPSHPLATGEVDRSTFYLLKQPSGVFTVPVNAYVSPGVNSISSATDPTAIPPPPLGYGASPISTGTGQESCPDSSVPIPAGYHWAKLWLFRASLNQRTIPQPGPVISSQPNKKTSLLQFGAMVCNPGDWAPNTAITSGLQIYPIFAGCPRDIADYGLGGDGQTSSGQALYASALSTKSTRADSTGITNGLLADRYLETGECVRLDAIAGATHATYQADYLTGTKLTNCSLGPGLGCGPEKEDYWATWLLDSPAYPSHPSDPFFNADQGVNPATGYLGAIGIGCNANTVIDPLNVCSDVVAPQTTKVSHAAAPYSMNVTQVPLDTGSSRYDFLFVVSPTNIMMTDVRDVTVAGAPYQPYRFETDVDCLDSTGNPSSFPNTDCTNGTSINTFGLKLHDVGSNGDAPATDLNRAGVFPVCVIQNN